MWAFGRTVSCSIQFSSVAQLFPTFCDTMECSTSDFPVHHQLPELAQIHVHRVGDAIKSFHLLWSLSPAFNLSSIRVFSNESALHTRWEKYWSFSFSISPSNKYSLLFSLGSTDLILQSKGLSGDFRTTIQKHQFFSA